MRTALALAVENPHIAVTFLPLACSGATIEAGIFNAQRARECPATGTCAGSVPAQLAQLRDLLARVQKGPVQAQPRSRAAHGRRQRHQVLRHGRRRHHHLRCRARAVPAGRADRFVRRGASASSSANSRRASPSCAQALKPMVGGDLSRVVFVSYGNPAMERGAACPGGRDGFDVHPAFTADAERLRRVSEFVSAKFLPKLKSLARCEAGTVCKDPATDRMTFVDSHLEAFSPARRLRARGHRSGLRPRMLLAEGRELQRRSGRGRDLAAGLQPAAERIPPLRIARPLDQDRERQLLHRHDVPARPAGDRAAQQHPRRGLGGDERGLWWRGPPDRRRPCRDGRRGAAGGARRAGPEAPPDITAEPLAPLEAGPK